MRPSQSIDGVNVFNYSLDRNRRRAIDMRKRGVLDAEAFKALIRAAGAKNLVVRGKYG